MNAEKNIYLTFDDGPTPEVTLRVLALLKEYNAKATFFCLGKNVEKFPEIYCLNPALEIHLVKKLKSLELL